MKLLKDICKLSLCAAVGAGISRGVDTLVVCCIAFIAGAVVVGCAALLIWADEDVK